MRHTDLSRDAKYNFIVPIGSLEQHGPFAPFGTDTYINDYLVDQVEKQFPELVILPTLEFSRAQEHRGFFGTVYLSKDTFSRVLFDICNSLFNGADHIFITSFHYNDPYIQKFIKEHSKSFSPAKIVHLEIFNEDDDKQIEAMLGGPVDDHAGNTEISNMLVIDESTVITPQNDDKKTFIENPFESDNLAEKSSNGVADNHPNWVVNKQIGQKSLNLYVERMVHNIKKHLE